MTKTVHGIKRKNELKAAELLKGKCRTIVVKRSPNNVSRFDIYGIDFRDWMLIRGRIQNLARK